MIDKKHRDRFVSDGSELDDLIREIEGESDQPKDKGDERSDADKPKP